MYHEIDNTKADTAIMENEGARYHQIGDDKSEEPSMRGFHQENSRHRKIETDKTKY